MILPQRIVLATRNRHKADEIRNIVGERFTLVDLSELDFPGDLPEDGDTLEANALQKARTAWQLLGLPALADDSGLEVDALHGAPGVHSARYAGPHRRDDENIRLLLNRLAGVGDRRARFRAVIALVGVGEEKVFAGVVEGRILEAPVGNGGFGYDPVFLPDGYDLSFAALGGKVKNEISHRARALQKLAAFFEASSTPGVGV